MGETDRSGQERISFAARLKATASKLRGIFAAARTARNAPTGPDHLREDTIPDQNPAAPRQVLPDPHPSFALPSRASVERAWLERRKGKATNETREAPLDRAAFGRLRRGWASARDRPQDRQRGR